MTTIRAVVLAVLDLWSRLPPYVRGAASTFVTAACSGGATALTAVTLDPDHFSRHDLHRVAWVFAGGALIGIINWCRQQPWTTRDAFVPLSKLR